MTRIVVVTQEVDPAHPALAATVPKIAALAARVDEVAVLAAGAVPGALPRNCRVRPFRASTKPGRGLRFGAALAAEVRGADAVLAHMCPIYALLAAPFARPLGVPLLLWYTHWHATATLRLAERVSTRIVSVDERSFPLPSGKLVAIGHGIDPHEFPCRPAPAGAGLRLLALGRYSESKGLDVVLRAVRAASDGALDARLVVHGPALTTEERRHRAELGVLAEELGIEARVELGDAVPRASLPSLFASADALVNNMRAGAPDKVVYEAAAACVPVLASNPVLDDLLDEELRFPREDADALAARLAAFAARPPAERAALGARLRERVADAHSVHSWAEGVLAAAGIS